MSSKPTSTDALAGKLKRTELQHEASSIPGREIVQVLTEIPAGVESGWHQHPGEEVGYILAGRCRWRSRANHPHPPRGRRIPDAASHAPQRNRPRPRHGPDALHLHRRSGAATGGIHRGRVEPQRSRGVLDTAIKRQDTSETLH